MPLTEDQQMIRDSAKAFVEDVSNPAVLQTWTPDQVAGDPAVWQKVRQEMGWPATLVPESLDGLGLNMDDMCLILEETGAGLLNAPLWSSGVWASLLVLLAVGEADSTPLLSALASGEITLAAALPAEGLSFDPAQLPDGESILSGDLSAVAQAVDAAWSTVPDAAAADRILLPARTADGALGWLLAPAGALDIAPHRTWDLSRPLACVRPKADCSDQIRWVHHADAASGTRDALALAALGQAAELSGSIRRCLEITVDYVKERVQFGRPVGGFQAVKHRCAQIMVELETTRSAMAAAMSDLPTIAQIMASGLSDLQRADIAAAVSQAKDAAFFAAQEAIQLHGGVGFTWEYEPHFHFKRAQSASTLLGTSAQWRESVAQHLFA